MNRVIHDPERGSGADSAGLLPGFRRAAHHRESSRLIGVVGVGGYPPNPPVWSDEICAHTALEKVIGPSVPPLMEDVPPQRNSESGSGAGAALCHRRRRRRRAAGGIRGGRRGRGKSFRRQPDFAGGREEDRRACRDWAASKGATMSALRPGHAGELVHMERMDGEVPRGYAHSALEGADRAAGRVSLPR